MSEPFKNIKELYQALVDNHTITNGLWKLKIDKNNKMIGSSDNQNWNLQNFNFSELRTWSIYEEPKWDDNIPECGVLCKTTHGAFVFIKGRCSNGTYIDCNGNTWINVEPLTKEEVMQYIWNGEDE